MSVKFEILGSNRVRNALRGLAAAHTADTDPIIEKHTKQQARRLRQKRYPPMLPNQKYRRTMELQKKFRAQRGGAARWRVINNRRGAQWVIKKGMQNRRYHKGRWWTMEDELQKTMPELTKKLGEKLEDIANG